MRFFLADLRAGFRSLRKSPGPAITAVLVLTVGIGATATIFSIVDGIILQGLPFEDGDRILHLETRLAARGGELRGVPVHDFVAWRQAQTSFEDLAAFYRSSTYISGSDMAERFRGTRISANAFGQLRVQAALGRTFQEADDRPGAPRVVLLAHSLWRDRYGSDPDIVGRVLLVDSQPATVVGVMPESFRFPVREDLWLPLQPDPSAVERGEGVPLSVFGRLREGVAADTARQEMALITQRLAAAHPESNDGVSAALEPYLLQVVDENERTLGFTSLTAVFFVLLIACSNVANLLLARAAARTRELAMRTVLGAGRGRIIAQVLAESLCLAALAAPLGIGLAVLAIGQFNRAVANQDWPYWFDVGVDATALGFVVAVTLLAALLAGLGPAVRASRLDINAILKDETRGGGLRIGRLSRALVVLQITFSCGLLIGGGLMVRSIVSLARIDFRFEPDGLFTGRIGLVAEVYPQAADQIRFVEALQRDLQQLPGAARVALADYLPAEAHVLAFYVSAEHPPASADDPPRARLAAVSPDFFATFGAELLAGRDFTPRDGLDGEPVVIVNQPFAEREWPGESALGKRLRLGRREGEAPWMRVVGVAPDLHMGGVINHHPEGLYVPLAQHSQRFLGIAVRSAGNPLALTAPIRDRVRALDPGLPVYFVQGMRAKIDRENFFYRLVAVVFSLLGVVALLLAAVGMYGVRAFSVRRRTAEIGVRMSQGATPLAILRMVLAQGCRQVALGLIGGLLLGAALGMLLRAQLFGIQPFDLPTFTLITLLLLATGVAASLLPGWRAMRIDPIRALRYE